MCNLLFASSLDDREQLEVIANKCEKLHRFTAKERKDVAIQFISNNPGDRDFLDFQVMKEKTSLGRYRAFDIHSLQQFVTSLGGKCLETTAKKGKKPKPRVKSHRAETMVSAGEIFMRSSATEVLSYSDALPCLPTAFYYTEQNSFTLSGDFTKPTVLPGSVLPMYNASTPLPPFIKRAMNDTFRPPCGRAVPYLYSLGYGKEVGLLERLQEVSLDSKDSIVLDHNQCRVSSVTSSILAPPTIETKWKYSYDERVEFVAHDGTSCGAVHAASVSQDAIDALEGYTLRLCEGCLHGTNTYFSWLHDDDDDIDDMHHGSHGSKGCWGKSAYEKSERPTNGEEGDEGSDGNFGGNGGHGKPGPKVKLLLGGSKQSLRINGSKQRETSGNFYSLKGEQVLLINCRGGNGGKGAEGGSGGYGGAGGSGGDGYSGDSLVTGRDGGDGGDGADGGNGGKGGNGDDGGRGGNSGDGGSCTIEAADPTLFMLVEVDCRSGKPGLGGDRGEAGRGGKGGKAGEGGRGGRCGRQAPNQTRKLKDGKKGKDGLRGDDGNDGKNGAPGEDGKSGENGSILWVVTSADGNTVIHQSSSRYDAEVLSYNVTPVFDDGVFEPNEKLTISGVTVRNSGGLPLPLASIAWVPSTTDVKFEQLHHKMPELEPGETYVIPVDYHGRISDIPPPNKPQACQKTIKFHSRIELLGKPFEKSLSTREISVQYPIQLLKLLCPKDLKRGEISTVSISIRNVSDAQYGCFKGSPGTVFLNLHFDSRLRPLGVVKDGNGQVPYEVTHDASIRDSTYIKVFKIPPKKTLSIKIAIQMQENAHLSEECVFQADLYLRKKLVQYKQRSIQASVDVNYGIKNPPADVLLVSNKDFTNKEFQFWEHIFNILEVSVDYWDIHQHSGLSVDVRTNARHEESWAGRYTGKMILYPHCLLKLLHGEDIATHFHGNESREARLQDLGSSLVLFMTELKSNSPANTVLKHLSLATSKVELPSRDLIVKHLCQPSMAIVQPHFSAWESSCMKALEKQIPSQAPVLLKREVGVTKVGFCQYSYGSADIHHVPILRSSKFVMIDGRAGDRVDKAVGEKYKPKPTDILLPTAYGQVLLATLYGISMPAKLKLIKSQANFSFHIPNKLILTRDELVMVTIAWEVADELYSFSGEHHRIKELYNDIKDNSDAYVPNGRAVLSGLNLTKKEVEKRASCVDIASTTRHVQEIMVFIKKVADILAANGVDDKDLSELPSLEILHASKSVHYCHQHFVDERKWDLT